MEDTLQQHDPAQVVRAAERFFARKGPPHVPPVLRRPGRWVLLDGKSYLALFYVTNASWQQFERYRNKQWHPFPGLFAPENSPALIETKGKKAYFDSNATSDGYAFRVDRSSSFILHNHRHSLPDPADGRVDYSVDLAFVVGLDVVPESGSVEDAFRQLFQHFLDVWRTRP